MPDVSDYLKAFGVKKGMLVNGYELTSLNVRHVIVIKYRRYSYPITMIWIPQRQSENSAFKDYIPSTSDSIAEFIEEFSQLTKDDRIVYSRFGNPYNCSFGHLQVIENDDQSVTVTTTGDAERIFGRR